MRGDLEPVVANEQEIAGSLLQLVEVALEHDIPMENLAKDFGWELGNVQQRISSAFKLDYGPLMLPDLLIQGPYGIDVGLATQPVL